MMPGTFVALALEPALELLPLKMRSPAAEAMILAICLQESGLTERVQVGGPAHGYPQFEQAGVHGVLTHPATKALAVQTCRALDYAPIASDVYAAVEHNDILACVFARLLLWTLPMPLPQADDPDEGWDQYVAAWRPGLPHRPTWDNFYEQAWEVIT